MITCESAVMDCSAGCCDAVGGVLEEEETVLRDDSADDLGCSPCGFMTSASELFGGKRCGRVC